MQLSIEAIVVVLPEPVTPASRTMPLVDSSRGARSIGGRCKPSKSGI